MTRTKNEVINMKIRKSAAAQEFFLPGTPFYPLNSDEKQPRASTRVIPSQFRFPVLPAACTFIRNLNEDNIL